MVVALALGFPVVVALAWAFDVKAGRIERALPTTGLRRSHVAPLLIGLGLLAAAPGLCWYLFSHRLRTPAGVIAPADSKSIAVLPFASLSAGEENARFAEAVHTELIGQIAKIGALTVISRTSVMQYKDGARNLREIGLALGVSHILEGSVQREGNRVRIQVQLIDAKSDREVWGNHYDKDLTDLFLIQSAVAEEIASALFARLSPEDKARLAQRPTQSTKAYDFYLTGVEYQNRSGFDPDTLMAAERSYRNAIEVAPSFALARAQLARVLITRYYYTEAGAKDSLAEEARQEAEQALRLRPDMAEGHLAIGSYYHRVRGDFADALREYELARSGMPAEAVQGIGSIQARQGRFEEAVRSEEQSARLDPRSSSIQLILAESLAYIRRYKESERALDRALAIAPDFTAALVSKGLLQEMWNGDSVLSQAILRDFPRRLDLTGWLRVIILMRLNPREGLPALDAIARWELAFLPKVFVYAGVMKHWETWAGHEKNTSCRFPCLKQRSRSVPPRRMRAWCSQERMPVSAGRRMRCARRGAPSTM